MAAKRAIGVDTRRARPQRNPRVRFVKRTALFFIILILLGVIALLVWFMSAYHNAPERMDSLLQTAQALNKRPSQILSSDGKVLYQVSTENRDAVKLSEIPVITRNAVIAAEDKRFYEHSGVDFIGIVRSAKEVARTQHATQGGSTLTMQLAKLLSDGSQKTVTRKMDDVALAIYMERQMTKDQILEMYLNTVYFGEGAYGIAAAAKVYFDKDLKNLTLGESAMLARCIRRPIINPIRNLTAATENRNLVLGIMKGDSMITLSQYDAAMTETPHVNRHPQRTAAIRPNGSEYFVDSILDILKSKYPAIDLKLGGYTIETTLDSRIQSHAEQAIKETIAKFHSEYKVNTAALVMIDRDGEILAEVGGANYRRNSYNAVTQGKMPPGSGFKPFVYASAFKDGILHSPEDWVSNAPIRQPDPSKPSGYWEPHNDSKKLNASKYTVRTALADSINLPAIHVIEDEGPDKVVDYAHDNFGFTSKLDPYAPLALGASAVSPVEMAQAYSVFMLRGDRVTPFAIKRIVGPDGSVIADFEPQFERGVWDPSNCETMDGLLRDVVLHGTAAVLPDGTALASAIPDARGKTGTTSNYVDAWFNGYADGLLAVVACYNEQKEHGTYNRKPMAAGAFGAKVALPIWKEVMEVALKVRPQTPIVAASEQQNTASTPAKTKNPDDETDGQDQPTPDPTPQAAQTIPTAPPAVAPSTGDTPDDTPPAPDATQPSNTAQPADKPSPPVKPVKKVRDEQYVDIEICDDTGLRATIYCPETTTRRFKKGSEPTKYCNVHTGNVR